MEKMKNVYKKSANRKLLYLLLCIGSVVISVLLCSCGNPLGSIDFDEECHYIGTINSDGFDSSYTFISVMINGRAVSDVKYNINFIEEGSRWMPKDPDDIIDYDDSEKYLKDSTGTFEIEFPPYVYNVDVKIDGYMDPFSDNCSNGEVELFAVFPSAAPVAFADEAERHLYIDYYGVLTYEIEESSKTYSTTYFMMRNLSFPAGDDFVIDFKTDEPDEFTGFDPPIDDFLGFFGVIDKRFLDEANLNIDEGSDDWNGEDQDPISLFTWHNHDNDEMTNTVIRDSVAYSIGSQDNPEEYNDKMEDQRTFLSVIRAYKGYTNYWYGDTRAPGDTFSSHPSRWGYYIRSQHIKDDFGIVEADVPDAIDNFEYPVNRWQLFGVRPYSPGFSSSWLAGTERFYRGQSAGVDCGPTSGHR